MQQRTSYADVVCEVRDHLAARVDAAVAAGVDPSRVILDPGLGFAKRPEHNWALLHGLDTITDLGLPVLVAASRKSFLGALLADDDGPRPTEGREDATTAVTALAAAAGAWAVRVHNVRPAADAVRVAARWGRG
jgi:dihydropteroate synthase